MKSRFQMSSMGELTFFLGLQVKQKEDGIFISQDKYVAEILKKFDFVSVKTASTPIETQKPLVKDEEASDVDVHLYRSMIGSLMYLTASRPDIMFAVCACSRFQVTPKTSHLSAVKRIFRYLKGKPKLGLWYPRVSSFDLEAYSDSDYAGANLDRKSTTGGCQFLGRRLISWQCKKQTIVATSTIEAEYVAAANCCGQVLWIQNQMLDYGFNFMNTKIYIDNESTICIVKNPVYHSKTKHIAIRHHFIRDAYEKKLIQVLKIHTNDNVADLLTKAFDVSSLYEVFSVQKNLDHSDDEHRKCLKIVTFEGTIDSEIMEKKSFISKLDKVSSPKGDYLVIHRANGNFRAFNYLLEVLHIFDRQDLFHLYNLMMEQYSEITLEGFELILWGDLKIMMESSTEDNDQKLEDGTVIHILVERMYPLSKDLLQRMLDLGLEVKRENVVVEDMLQKDSKRCQRLLKIRSRCVKVFGYILQELKKNKPKKHEVKPVQQKELTIPEQTATDVAVLLKRHVADKDEKLKMLMKMKSV
ncbi:putative ribonuclease H-like domain-containing protein [Tanacetum coccineum]